MSDLSIKTTKGMLWSLAQNLGLQSIQLVISIILARLLLPAQFGLIGMLTIFIVFAQNLLDSGFGLALIQKKDASQLDNCSVFYFNLLVGMAMTGLLCLAAPLIAAFFRQPILIPLTRFFSLIILINAFCLVPSALLRKRMDFKALLIVSLVSVVISGGVGVVMALRGFGVWSLVVQSVLNTLVNAILLWKVGRWHPQRIFSLISLKTLFSFGSRMMITSVLESIFQNIYQPLIGKLYSASDVGYYARAQSLKSVAISPAGSVMWTVMVPALSSIQDDNPRIKQAIRKTMIFAALFQFPLMIGMMVMAGPTILLLLTDRWAPSILYFQLLSLAGLSYPFQVLNLNVLVAIGRSDLFLKIDIARMILVILAIAICYHWGILALIIGQVVTSIISDLFLNSYYSKRLINYSIGQQVLDTYPFFLMALGMGVIMYLIGIIISPLFMRLLAQFFVGVIVYLGLNYILCRSVFYEVMDLAKQLIQMPIRS
jgi:O-antigen/teichoic acid export membrane protein